VTLDPSNPLRPAAMSVLVFEIIVVWLAFIGMIQVSGVNLWVAAAWCAVATLLWALLLRALLQGGPRWLAFYRLQRALATREPDPARWALLAWAALRLGRPCQHLANLPCHGDPAMGTLLDDLDRACFAAPGAASQGVDWQRLAQSLCARETFAIAYVLRKLAWARP